MAGKQLSVTLPSAVARRVQAASKKNRSSQSQVVREALELYFACRIAVAEPEADEIEAIAIGKRQLAVGEFVTLTELSRDLDRNRQ